MPRFSTVVRGVIVVAACLATGCFAPAATRPADRPVVVVSAACPDADGPTVAELVAAPLEQQLHGAEGVRRIESESRDDGSYTARLWLDATADPERVRAAVRERAALAEPSLPEETRRRGVAVELGPPAGTLPPAIALVARGDVATRSLRERVESIRTRLTTDGAIVAPAIFPGPDEPRVEVSLDREKAAARRVSADAVAVALHNRGAKSPRDLLVTNAAGEKVPLSEIATITESPRPVGVYRVDLRPAVKLSGSPGEGRSLAQAVAAWRKVAEAEASADATVETLVAE